MAQYLMVVAVFLPMILGALGAGNLTTEYLATSRGYPIETHKVTTNDGYILTVHRIPYSPKLPRDEPKKVVFVQHGLLCSSGDWLLHEPEKGLAFLLSDAGYDVWLGNARGNTYSRAHTTLDPSSKAFWDFDWHEIGVIDLPAMIDYVLQQTGVKKVVYIGHSQGTTSFFVLNSVFPDFNQYFESAHMLSPVAYMSHLTSKFVTYAAPFIGHPTLMSMDLLGNYEFKPNKKMMEVVGKMMCSNDRPNKILCSNPLFLAAGFDEETVENTLVNPVMETTPAGASTKQFLHYIQEVTSGKFRHFDYGMARNLLKYGQTKPPEYPIGNIDVPLYLYYSDNDALSAVKDVQQLISELNSVVEAYRVADTKFDHLGMMYHAKIREHVYDRLLDNIRNNTRTGRVG